MRSARSLSFPRPGRAAGLLLALACFTVTALAQDGSPPAFDIDIRAPEAQRTLLQQNLELRLYRQVTDLDDSELARLLVLAERDARQLLGTQGFFNPRIELSTDRSTRPPRVVISVEPGQAARVSESNLEFTGDIATTTDKDAIAQRDTIRQDWRLPPGHAFTQDAWSDAKSHAVRGLVARRYPRGRIADSVADVDAATGQARLGLRLDSGPLFRLGPMQVIGTERYDPVLVPRLARLGEGSVYDQDRITQAQLRLTGSGYYDSAFIYVNPDSDPQAAPVQVNVREAKLQKVTLGVGVSTDSGPRLSLEHRHNRVPGIGWRADSMLQLDRRTPAAQTEWTALPDKNGWRWGTLARVERTSDVNGQQTRALRLRGGRSQTGDHIDRNVYVQFERAVVSDATGVITPEDRGDGTALTANYVWTGRYFDNATVPTRGHGLGFELGGGLTLTGSRSPFQRTVARWKGLIPLTQGRLALRAEGGAVLAKSTARVPATQLFRTGGDTTVRGYSFRSIGVDRNGVVGPGRYMAVGSVEWQRPIRRNGLPTPLEHALFVDAGAVADAPGDLRPSVGVGTGIRYLSPVGALQADLAYGLKARRFRVHFIVGVTF